LGSDDSAKPDRDTIDISDDSEDEVPPKKTTTSKLKVTKGFQVTGHNTTTTRTPRTSSAQATAALSTITQAFDSDVVRARNYEHQAANLHLTHITQLTAELREVRKELAEANKQVVAAEVEAQVAQKTVELEELHRRNCSQYHHSHSRSSRARSRSRSQSRPRSSVHHTHGNHHHQYERSWSKSKRSHSCDSCDYPGSERCICHKHSGKFGASSDPFSSSFTLSSPSPPGLFTQSRDATTTSYILTPVKKADTPRCGSHQENFWSTPAGAGGLSDLVAAAASATPIALTSAGLTLPPISNIIPSTFTLSPQKAPNGQISYFLSPSKSH
jgi:hypothetical protein